MDTDPAGGGPGCQERSPPRADRRSAPVHTCGRQRRLHRTVLGRMSTVPGPRRRQGRAVAVPVLRLGRLLGRLAEPARPSPLRGDRPPRRRPASPQLAHPMVLRPRTRGLNPAAAHVRTPVVVAWKSRARPRPQSGPPTRHLRRSYPVRVPCRSRRNAGSRVDGTPVDGGCRAGSPDAGHARGHTAACRRRRPRHASGTCRSCGRAPAPRGTTAPRP